MPGGEQGRRLYKLLEHFGFEVSETTVKAALDVLGKPTGTRNSIVPPDMGLHVLAAVKEAVDAAKEQKDDPTPAASDAQGNGPGRSLVRTGTSRQSGRFRGGRRMELTPDDRMILNQLEPQIRKLRKAIEDDQRKPLPAPRGQVKIPDVLHDDRFIVMSIEIYWERKHQDVLPLVTKTTLREIANELAKISLVSNTCSRCGGALKVDMFREAKLLVEGNRELPLNPHDPKAVRFHNSHLICATDIRDLIRDVVVEMPEADIEQIGDAVFEKLMADGGRLLAKMVAKESDLSARELRRRFKAALDAMQGSGKES